MADLKIDIASVFSGKKAFADAAKSTINLNSQVKNLAKSYLGLFTAQQLARRSFDAAKAFAADDKAARVLTQSLNNLGLAFADPSVRNFIADLEKQFGVLDDQLRPAFQRLLTTTGDVAKSQSLLRTALDLSAASGQDVVTVAGDLSKGFVGQTRALAKYGIGLTQTQLKAMTFEEVQTRINDLFGGQATTAVNTYSGSLQRLSVAANNAKEVIGGGLLDALAALGGGGEGGLQNTLSLIEKTSTALATFVRRFGVGVGQLAALARGDLKAFQAIGQTEMNRGKDTSGITPAIRAELNKAAAEKAAAKNRTALLKVSKEQLKVTKDQIALQKAGTIFDLEKGQIIAALKGKISDEERKRLELQLAILNGNTSEASKLAGELATSQGLTKDLADYLANRLPAAKNPFAAWKDYLDEIERQATRIAGMRPAAPTSIVGGNDSGVFSPAVQEIISSSTIRAGATSGGDVNVYIGGSVVSEADLVEAVRNGLLERDLSGSPSSIGRLKGSFGA
jgi:hypothetical protein